jgi:hypothetical protein
MAIAMTMKGRMVSSRALVSNALTGGEDGQGPSVLSPLATPRPVAVPPVGPPAGARSTAQCLVLATAKDLVKAERAIREKIHHELRGEIASSRGRRVGIASRFGYWENDAIESNCARNCKCSGGSNHRYQGALKNWMRLTFPESLRSMVSCWKRTRPHIWMNAGFRFPRSKCAAFSRPPGNDCRNAELR